MQYFLSCMTTKYAQFEGRARPAEFWFFQLFYLLVVLVMYAVALGVIAAAPESRTPGSIIIVLMGLFVLIAFIPGLAVSCRRLHDTNRSGWFYLLSFIPFVGIIILIVFWASEGTKGPNQYGPDPIGDAERQNSWQPIDQNRP